MYFWQDEMLANVVHDICIWYMIKCQHVSWNTTGLLYCMVSSKKIFNSGKRKYILGIIYLKKNIPHFASKGSPQRAVTGSLLWASVWRRTTRKQKMSSDCNVSCWRLSIIWAEQNGKKACKRRKFQVFWNSNLHMGPNVAINCITFSVIVVLNSQIPEKVRSGLADSKYEENWHNEEFWSALLLVIHISKVFQFSFSLCFLELIRARQCALSTLLGGNQWCYNAINI